MPVIHLCHLHPDHLNQLIRFQIYTNAQKREFEIYALLCSCTNDHLLFVKLSDNNTCHGLVLFPAFYVYLLVAKLPNS